MLLFSCPLSLGGLDGGQGSGLVRYPRHPGPGPCAHRPGHGGRAQLSQQEGLSGVPQAARHGSDDELGSY